MSNENNLGPIHETCNKTKTAADVAEKSKVYKKAAKNIGISLRKGPKIRSGGFQPAAAQRQASRPVDKWRGYSP